MFLEEAVPLQVIDEPHEAGKVTNKLIDIGFAFPIMLVETKEDFKNNLKRAYDSDAAW